MTISATLHRPEVGVPNMAEPVLVVSEPADDLQVEIIGGRVPYCRPADKPRSAGERFIIAIASLWISQGKTAQASLMLAGLQRGLGVTPEDHIGAVELAFVADRTARGPTQRARQAHEFQRAKALSAPLREPVFTQEIERDLKSIARLEKVATRARETADKAREGKRRRDHKTALAAHRKALDDLRVLRRRVHLARGAQVDTRWADSAVAETIALSTLRGQVLDEEDTAVSDWLRDPETGRMVEGGDGLPVLKVERSRAKRRPDTTGLALAFEKGDLDPSRPNAKPSAERLYEIGKLYRSAFLVANNQLTPSANEVRAGVPSGPQYGAVVLTRDFATMQKGLTKRQSVVLNAVCGCDISVGTTAKQNSMGAPSVRRALRGGLVKAMENLEEREAEAKRRREAAA